MEIDDGFVYNEILDAHIQKREMLLDKLYTFDDSFLIAQKRFTILKQAKLTILILEVVYLQILKSRLS